MKHGRPTLVKDVSRPTDHVNAKCIVVLQSFVNMFLKRVSSVDRRIECEVMSLMNYGRLSSVQL